LAKVLMMSGERQVKSSNPGRKATAREASRGTAAKKGKREPLPTRTPEKTGSEERLNRFLARAGIVSRREADRVVFEGRVTLNGQVVREPGTRVNLDRDSVKVDGKRVTRLAHFSYYLFYKPRGVLTTMEDPLGRPCLGDVLRDLRGRPVPAGRLDGDAEGLVLCTNDGELINRLLHPRYGAKRVYEVKINGVPDRRALQRLETGIFVDGTKTLPARVAVIRKGDRNSWLRIVLAEGRNRQVKRMVEEVGFRVLKLRRVAFGPLSLQGVQAGQFRKLGMDEIVKLRGYTEELDKKRARL